jgi:bifunctional DNase/RNase
VQEQPHLSWVRPAVDARSSDALNLAALVQAPILVTPEVLVDAEARRTGDSPEAARLREARVAQPITFGEDLSE